MLMSMKAYIHVYNLLSAGCRSVLDLKDWTRKDDGVMPSQTVRSHRYQNGGSWCRSAMEELAMASAKEYCAENCEDMVEPKKPAVLGR